LNNKRLSISQNTQTNEFESTETLSWYYTHSERKTKMCNIMMTVCL
jgi:hypothetical protein